MAATAPFATYIAHELRTPLATQRALLELGLSDPGTDAAGWRGIAQDVLDACTQQEQLLEACLALGRAEAGLGPCETVDLASLTARLLRTKDLKGLIADLRLERALATGVPSLIERLLDNLLANAIRHNRAGGWIAVTVRQTETHALLTVENSGRQIPPAELRRLFEPFERLGSSAGGLGLGLAIVKTIADAHHAFVAARPLSGGGLGVDVGFAPAA